MSYRYDDSSNDLKADLIYIGSSTHDDSVWNYGYCDCGGQWVYQQAVGHRFSTCYIYECDKCGELSNAIRL